MLKTFSEYFKTENISNIVNSFFIIKKKKEFIPNININECTIIKKPIVMVEEKLIELKGEDGICPEIFINDVTVGEVPSVKNVGTNE